MEERQQITLRLVTASLVFILASFALSRFLIYPNFADPDLWGHLRFGQDICQAHSIPRVDTYSYVSGGRDWINHEWLSQVVFYLVYRFAGSTGLVLFKLLVFAGLGWLLFSALRAQTKSAVLRLAFGLFSTLVLLGGFTYRPQIFTFILFPAVLMLLQRYDKSSDPRWLYPLPVIFPLWANLHGGFLAGAGALALYTLFAIFRRKCAKALAAAVAASLALTLVNPYGVRLWSFLFHAVTMPRPNIDEWKNITLVRDFFQFYVLAGLAALGLVFSKKRRDAFEMTLLGLGLALSLLHFRHSVLFAAMVVLFVPAHMDSFAGPALAPLEKKFAGTLLVPAFVLAGAVFLVPAFHARSWKIRIDESLSPVNAVRFLKVNGITGNIFCNLEWGELCISELTPGSRVFFDGRCDNVYDDATSAGYFETLNGKRDFRDFLERFPETDILFLSTENAMQRAVAKAPEWIEIYSVPPAKIYARDNERNRQALEGFRAKKLIYPSEKGPFYFK